MCLVEVQKKSLIESIPAFFQLSKHARSVPVCSNDEVWQPCHGERKITTCFERTYYSLSARWVGVAVGTFLSVP